MRSRIVFAALLVLPALLAQLQASIAQSSKPPIPPGAPTRMMTVALLSDGIDYTRPGIAAKLARDGEGVVIGWDAVDNDQRPFLRDGAATRLVSLAPTLVAPFRLELASAASWERVLAVLAQTPARVAVVAAPPSKLASAASTPWDAQMAKRPEILFIVPADEGVSLAAMAANVIVVSTLPAEGKSAEGKSGADLLLAPAAATREAPLSSALPATAAEAAILLPGVFACTELRAAKTPADVKKTLIAKGAKGPPGSPPLLGLCR